MSKITNSSSCLGKTTSACCLCLKLEIEAVKAGSSAHLEEIELVTLTQSKIVSRKGATTPDWVTAVVAVNVENRIIGRNAKQQDCFESAMLWQRCLGISSLHTNIYPILFNILSLCVVNFSLVSMLLYISYSTRRVEVNWPCRSEYVHWIQHIVN